MMINKYFWQMTPEERKEAQKQIDHYGDKVHDFIVKGNFIPLEKGEQPHLCLPPYQPNWIVTNYARVFSIKPNSIIKLKPYAMSNDPYRKYLDGYDENGKKVHFSLHRIVADHFCKNISGCAKYHVHHIKPARLFTPEENEKNIPHRAANLEIVEPNYQHTALTFLQQHPTLTTKEAEDYMQNLTKKVANDPNLIPLSDIKEPEIKQAILQMIQNATKKDVQISNTDGNGAAWMESGTNINWDNINSIITIIR